MKTLILALLSPIVCFAAPIDWSQQDLYSTSELVNDCVSATSADSAQKCKDLIKNARAELPAWEACTMFQMPEENAADQAPRSEAQIKAAFGRMNDCLPIVDGKAFAPNALDICGATASPGNQQTCLKGIADGSFHNAAFNLCTEHADTDAEQSALCLSTIKDKNFSADEIASCNSGNASQRSNCLKSKGSARNDVKECNQKLADVQTKISGLAANSSETNLKNQLQSIVDAIQNQTPSHAMPGN